MLKRISKRLTQRVIDWLLHECQPTQHNLTDFDRLKHELRPGDVILVEGRSRVSEVIKLITQSAWTHAALYIGRLYDIADEELRAKIAANYIGDANEQLLIEAILGKGTIVTPLSDYKPDNLRICRPRDLSTPDSRHVLATAIRRLGTTYDVRQLFDLARFLLPYAILPRRWRSSLFTYRPGHSTQTVCSSMLAEAFNSVHFPIIPFSETGSDGKLHLMKRNPRLLTPKDFDYSPYFDIVKYPYFGEEAPHYQRLHWRDEGLLYCNTPEECYTPGEDAAIENADQPLQKRAKLLGGAFNALLRRLAPAQPPQPLETVDKAGK